MLGDETHVAVRTATSESVPPVSERPAPAAPAPRSTTASQVSAVPSLAREVELIDRAMVALRADDPGSALATLTIYQHETAGHGQLAEDAAAIDIEARCRRHEPVSDLLAAFERRWPHSAQRTRFCR
jgi:hypothetical protein